MCTGSVVVTSLPSDSVIVVSLLLGSKSVVFDDILKLPAAFVSSAREAAKEITSSCRAVILNLDYVVVVITVCCLYCLLLKLYTTRAAFLMNDS